VTTVKEIQTALPQLSSEELGLVDVALLEQFRQRKICILYDDAYGVWSMNLRVPPKRSGSAGG
jgi:hypothetical protein